MSLSSVSNMCTCLNNFFHSGYMESVSGQDMYLCIHIRGYTIECWGIGASLFNEKSIRIPLGNGSGWTELSHVLGPHSWLRVFFTSNQSEATFTDSTPHATATVIYDTLFSCIQISIYKTGEDTFLVGEGMIQFISEFVAPTFDLQKVGLFLPEITLTNICTYNEKIIFICIYRGTLKFTVQPNVLY